MAKGPEIPSELERLFDQPGREWSPAQQQRVKTWLVSAPLPRLLVIVQMHLGRPATPEDAEDAFACFCEKRLDKVMERYDPSQGRRFWSFFVLTLKRYCYDTGDVIRRYSNRLSPLEAESDGDIHSIELVDDTGSADPVASAIRDEFVDLLRTCLPSLGPDGAKLKEVFILRYLHDFSVAEIATRLCITQNHVGVLAHTARQRIRECLLAKGWLP